MQLSSMLPTGQAGPFGAAPRNETYAAGPFAAAPQEPQAPAPMPQGGPFVQPSSPPDQNRQRLQMLLPAIMGGLSSSFGLNGAAAMMAGVMRGQERKRALTEHDEDRRVRKATEAAKFRLDALSELSKLPPEQQAVYMEAMADVGRELYGVDLSAELGRVQEASGGPKNFSGVIPGTGIPTSTAGPTAKQKASAAEIVKRNDAVAKGRRWSATDPETGQSRSDAEWRQLAGGGGTLEDGTPLLPEAEKDEPADLTKSGLDVQLADAMRREAAGDPKAAADVARLKKAIGEADALRRDPQRQPIVVTVGNSGLTPDQIRLAGTLRDDYRAQAKDYFTVRDAYERVQAAGANPTPAGDVALLYAYMKILDPGSVVRETEFATAAKTGSLPQQIQAAALRAVNGQRLTPEQRADFLSRAKGLYDKTQARHTKRSTQFKDMARQSGLPESLVVVDEAPAEEPAAAGGDVNSALAKLEARRKARGAK